MQRLSLKSHFIPDSVQVISSEIFNVYNSFQKNVQKISKKGSLVFLVAGIDDGICKFLVEHLADRLSIGIYNTNLCDFFVENLPSAKKIKRDFKIEFEKGKFFNFFNFKNFSFFI